MSKATKPSSREFLIILGILFAVAVVFNVLSMAIPSSSPVYDDTGRPVTEQALTLPDGHLMNFQSRNYGWPVAYYQTYCWGLQTDCRWARGVQWGGVVANVLSWFAFAAVAWGLYYWGIRPRSKSRRRR